MTENLVKLFFKGEEANLLWAVGLETAKAAELLGFSLGSSGWMLQSWASTPSRSRGPLVMLVRPEDRAAFDHFRKSFEKTADWAEQAVPEEGSHIVAGRIIPQLKKALRQLDGKEPYCVLGNGSPDMEVFLIERTEAKALLVSIEGLILSGTVGKPLVKWLYTHLFATKEEDNAGLWLEACPEDEENAAWLLARFREVLNSPQASRLIDYQRTALNGLVTNLDSFLNGVKQSLAV